MSEVRSRLGLARLALVFYLLAIFIGGGMRIGPRHVMAPLFSADKLLHGLIFAAFVPILWAALSTLVSGRYRRILAAVVLSTAVGGLLELFQAALPHRGAEFLDLVADGIGAAAAGLVLIGVTHRRAEAGAPGSDT